MMKDIFFALHVIRLHILCHLDLSDKIKTLKTNWKKKIENDAYIKISDVS